MIFYMMSFRQGPLIVDDDVDELLRLMMLMKIVKSVILKSCEHHVPLSDAVHDEAIVLPNPWK